MKRPLQKKVIERKLLINLNVIIRNKIIYKNNVNDINQCLRTSIHLLLVILKRL